jgi:very-short-patch-repair endonuclease
VADFCCLRERIVIEVDGNQHGFDENVERDAIRTKELERQGFRVLRFSNREVMTSIDVVLDTIFAVLGTAPSTPLGFRPSRPSPPGEGK